MFSFKPQYLLFSVLISASVFCYGQGSTNIPTAISANSGAMIGVTPDSRGWTDPALGHNRLLQNQLGEGAYKVIGNFKVLGSPYLYGGNLKADMFTSEAKAYNITISYNTFNQEVEFISTSNPDAPLIREPGSIDSFLIQASTNAGIMTPLKFVYGSILGSKEKAYFLEIYSGNRFSIYKRYKSEMGYVSSNYVQSELRQFDLQVEYFYTDTQGKGVKKIKPNSFTVIKEFKDVKDLSAIVTTDDFSVNPDAAFTKAFEALNN